MPIELESPASAAVIQHNERCFCGLKKEWISYLEAVVRSVTLFFLCIRLKQENENRICTSLKNLTLNGICCHRVVCASAAQPLWKRAQACLGNVPVSFTTASPNSFPHTDTIYSVNLKCSLHFSLLENLQIVKECNKLTILG